MGAIFTVYYLIEPKPELTTELSDLSELYYIPFLEPNLWTSEEDYDGAETDVEIENAINTMKIVFMLNLVMHQRGQEDSLHSILGNPPIFSIEMFDRWWTIDRYFISGELQSTIKRASVEEIQQLQKSDIVGIDQWLERLIHIKSNPTELDEIDQQLKQFIESKANRLD